MVGGGETPNYFKNKIVGPTLEKLNNMCQNVFDKILESLIEQLPWEGV